MSLGSVADKMENLPFTLLEVNDPIWTFEAMPCAIHSNDTSCGITLGKLCVGMVHSVEARPASVDLKRCQWR